MTAHPTIRVAPITFAESGLVRLRLLMSDPSSTPAVFATIYPRLKMAKPQVTALRVE